MAQTIDPRVESALFRALRAPFACRHCRSVSASGTRWAARWIGSCFSLTRAILARVPHNQNSSPSYGSACSMWPLFMWGYYREPVQSAHLGVEVAGRLDVAGNRRPIWRPVGAVTMVGA